MNWQLHVCGNSSDQETRLELSRKRITFYPHAGGAVSFLHVFASLVKGTHLIVIFVSMLASTNQSLLLCIFIGISVILHQLVQIYE